MNVNCIEAGEGRQAWWSAVKLEIEDMPAGTQA